MGSIAFQGEHGAYSELAALQYFGNSTETLPCRTFEDVFDCVANGKAEFGVIPIENSLEGSIGQNYDLLTKSSLNVVGETILRIEHCLIANPGTELKDLKTVYSHPQALGQCRKFIEGNGLKAVPVYDTAGSVKQVKETGERDAAGIASELTAKIYKMEILKKGIESDKNNFTRFLAISKKKHKGENSKTSMTFMLKDRPGSLCKVLQGLAANEINMTKLESRAIIGKPWEYGFYVDVEADANSAKMKRALAEIGKEVDFLKILGTYPKAGSHFYGVHEPGVRSLGLLGKNKVAVIGAAGGMGKWFCRFLLSEGLQVVASGRTKSKLDALAKEADVTVAQSNVDAVKQADIIFVSVPLTEFEGVIAEIAPNIRDDQVIMDIISSKEEPVRIMHKYIKGATVLGTHPLFGPKADSTNQNFVLTPTNVKEEKISKGFEAWLTDLGFNVTTMSPKKHDEVMSVALGLSHFVGLALGQTWTSFNFDELKNATPTSFKRLLGLVENIAESDPNFYANLQIILPNVLAAEEKFVENANRLIKLVKEKDERGFAEEMERFSSSIRKST